LGRRAHRVAAETTGFDFLIQTRKKRRGRGTQNHHPRTTRGTNKSTALIVRCGWKNAEAKWG